MAYNLFEELEKITKNHLVDFFEESSDKVDEVSFSAEAISPDNISISSNVPDSDTFTDFISVIDKTMMNSFVDLFKKGKNVEGSLISLSFNYKDANVSMDLTAKKSSKDITRSYNKEVDWYSISMASLTINSVDKAFNDDKTYLQRIQEKIKTKKIRNDSPEYFVNLLTTIRVLLEKNEDRKKISKEKLDDTK